MATGCASSLKSHEAGARPRARTNDARCVNADTQLAAKDRARQLRLEPVFRLAGIGTDVHVADLDGDGASDLVYLDAERRLHVRKSIRSGDAPDMEQTESEPPIQLGSGGAAGAARIEVRDFDHDGRADVLEMRANGEHALWLRNPAGDGFLRPGEPGGVPISPGHGAPSSALLADLDADGALDSARINPENGRVECWRLWRSPQAALTFDREQGRKWDVSFRSGRARYVAGSAQVGHFVGSGSADQLLLELADGHESALALLGLDVTSGVAASVSVPTPFAGAVLEPAWARGDFAPDGLVSVDLDRDGFTDLIELAKSGALNVFRGGEPLARSASAAGLPRDDLRCVGSPKQLLAFAELDSSPGLDLVRVPVGRGSIDAWLGELWCDESGAPLPSFGPVSALGFVEHAPRLIAPFRDKGAAAGPRRDDVALVTGDELGVYRAVPADPGIDTESSWERKLRVGFERFLSVDRLKGRDYSYPSEAAVIELSAWRFLRGRRQERSETLSDAACLRAIADAYRVRNRVAAYPGNTRWLASSHMDVSKPPEQDSHDSEHANWDYQSRLVIDFMTSYRVLGNADFLAAAEAAGDRFLAQFERQPLDDTDCGQGVPCRSFVIEPGNGKLHVDPNQNLEIALAFALLISAPASRYHAALYGNAYSYRADDGGKRSIDLQQVISEEVIAAFSAQSAETGSTSYERDARDGGLLMSTSECYVDLAAFDTRYGAYALQSAIWLLRELGDQGWFQQRLTPFLLPRLGRAAAWLERWSVPSPYHSAPATYTCRYRCGGCTTVPVVEWDASARYPSLELLRRQGERVCPRVLTLADWSYVAHGFQPLIFNELIGVPRELYGATCN